jgi:MtrB/PioB family decaheme-associated outer membrane protein
MKIRNGKMRISLLTVAVQGALLAMCAMPANAEEEDAAALKNPTNFVEIGAANVSKSSAKFGEYNGLNKSGGKVIGNFSVRGGDAYGGNTGTRRWSFTGSDLGTTSRALGATVGNQGQWNFGINDDELRHIISDTYQTPQQGTMGGNTFTLPATFGTVNAQPAAPNTVTLNPTQLAAFHTEDVGTTRKNSSFNVGLNFSPELSLQFGYNRLKQSGAKLMASPTSGAVVAPAGGTWRAEAIAVLMNPTNYQTDNFDLALNWIGEKGHLTGSYYASSFSNGYDRLTWQNPMQSSAGYVGCASGGSCTYQTTTMSTAPNNNFNQLNVSGGYALSPATKLAGGISYGRNTQNASFLTGLPEIVAAPQASLNGLVVTKHADLKLTHQSTRDLALSAGFKHNERDNQTPSRTYQYYAINSVVAGVDAATNAPYSNKKTELELAGDLRLDKSQSMRLAYNHEKISRWCNSMANGFNNCVVSPSSKEDKLGISYKLKATNDVRVNVGYTYAKRTAQFDHSAVTPLSGLNSLTPADVNAQDFPGFAAYIYASRKQQLLKAGVNWLATEKLDVGLNGRYTSDKYDANLGVLDSRTTGINLDTTYSYTENSSVAAYLSWRDSKRNLRNGWSAVATDNAGPIYANLVAPTSIWTNQLTDKSNAVGLNSKQSGLMGGKLELNGDLSYSLDKTAYATQLGYANAQCSPPTNTTACGALPDIKNRVITLKLAGNYQLDKSSRIALGYIFQQRKSDDYYYNAYQYGYAPLRIMPTNQLAPNYSINVVTASYIYNF